MLDVKFIVANSWLPSGINKGPLILPKGLTVNGELVAIGENDEYLHCIVSGSGVYYGIFKETQDKDHLYFKLRELNAQLT